MIFFFLAYFWSIKVSGKLNFRFQYGILLVVYFLPLLIENIFHTFFSLNDETDEIKNYNN